MDSGTGSCEFPESSSGVGRVPDRFLSGIMEFMPIVVEGLVCSAVYSAGLSCAQHVGMKLKVSCACAPAASILGALSVMCSAATAGQAGPLAMRYLFPEEAQRQRNKKSAARRQKQKARNGQQRELTIAEQAVCHAALGLVSFKLAGGRFSSLMPSDLCFPGAFRAKSIPARWNRSTPRDFTKQERAEVGTYLTRDGCHHCGAKPSLDQLVLDHIPPSSWVKGLSPPLKFQWGRLWNRSGLNPLTHPSMDIHGLVNPQARRGNVQERLKTAQRLFPQCRPCSTVQGPAVNNNNRVLVPKRAVSWLLPHAASAVVFTTPVLEKCVDEGMHVWLLPQRWKAFEKQKWKRL